MSQYTGAEKRAIIERAEKMLAEPGASQRTVADRLPISQSTLCEWLREAGVEDSGRPKGGPEPAGVTESGGQITITDSPRSSDPRQETAGDQAEALMRKRGYDPDLYVVEKVVTSEWGNPDEPMFQDKVWARRKDSCIILPDFKDFEPFEYGQVPVAGDRRVALVPDLHAPFENELAVGAVLDFLYAEEPEEVVFLGDAGDHTRLSKHRTHPRFNAMLNDTNDRIAQNFRRFREAVPQARMVFNPGNHDDRILYYSREVGGELAEVRPGKLFEDEAEPNPSLGYRELYRLDDLGIELVDEDWKLAEHRIAPELSARHGYLTGNNSERKLLETHGRSQVHAHDHRGTITYRTKHDPLDIRVAMSCGTLSQVLPDGLGYQPDPDWTPGMGWAHVWEDGLFQLSFLPFVQNKLLTPWGMAFEGRSY